MPRWKIRMVKGNWTVAPGRDTGTLMTPYGERFRFARRGDVWELPRNALISLAGIHPPEARARCAAALDRASVQDPDLPHLFEIRPVTLLRIVSGYGGIRPPIVGLPFPATSIDDYVMDGFQEAMGQMADLDDDPASRYESLLARYQELIDGSDPVYRDPMMLTAVLTAQLEHWRDGRVWQLPQAVAYALSAHPAWRQAALAWLMPHRGTWVRDYVARHPQVKTLVRIVAKNVPGMPIWLRRS